MTIKSLGRWSSPEIAPPYTRSITFDDRLKHYRAVLN